MFQNSSEKCSLYHKQDAALNQWKTGDKNWRETWAAYGKKFFELRSF